MLHMVVIRTTSTCIISTLSSSNSNKAPLRALRPLRRRLVRLLRHRPVTLHLHLRPRARLRVATARYVYMDPGT